MDHREEIHEEVYFLTSSSRIEHRMRKEEMEEQFSKEAEQGWRLAAAKMQAVRIARIRREEFS